MRESCRSSESEGVGPGFSQFVEGCQVWRTMKLLQLQLQLATIDVVAVVVTVAAPVFVHVLFLVHVLVLCVVVAVLLSSFLLPVVHCSYLQPGMTVITLVVIVISVAIANKRAGPGGVGKETRARFHDSKHVILPPCLPVLHGLEIANPGPQAPEANL